MTREWDPDTLFAVFESEAARRILALVSLAPMSAQELAEECDGSLPTVYRRLDVLEEFDLVESKRRVDDDGTHYEVYETRLESVEYALEDGDFTIDVRYRHEVATEADDGDPTL